MKQIAIITGASAGLGAEFVKQLEQYFNVDELWLVARREDRLHKVAQQLKKTKAQFLALDLAKSEDRKKLHTKLQVEEPKVRLFINNAGLGKIGSFARGATEDQMQMVHVNVVAFTELMHFVLPFMEKGSHIMNVASSIAFAPAPYFAVYAATKSYTLSLSHGLRVELKERGIHIMALCPGPVDTEFFTVASQGQGEHNYEKKGGDFLKVPAPAVVSLAYRNQLAGKSVCVPGFWMKLFRVLSWILPVEVQMKMTGAKSIDEK